jgi:hypothetical protein
MGRFSGRVSLPLTREVISDTSHGGMPKPPRKCPSAMKDVIRDYFGGELLPGSRVTETGPRIMRKGRTPVNGGP